MADELPIWLVVQDLRRIKLPAKDREFILAIDQHGASALPPADVARVRLLAHRYAERIHEMQAARERARKSVALEKQGTCLQTRLDEQKQQRKPTIPRPDPRGFGF